MNGLTFYEKLFGSKTHNGGKSLDRTSNKGAPRNGTPSTPRTHSTKSYWNYKGGFDRARLPHPSDYFAQQGLKLSGGGGWKDAICPFHADTKPSLRVRLDTGAFRCMACGAHGGDVLAFHMLRYGLRFVDAAKNLNAWRGAR